MGDKPTSREKKEAYLAFFHAPTLEQKGQILAQYRDILLRKYGFFEGDIGMVSAELMQQQGADVESAMRHGFHTNLINDARNMGIEAALQKASQNPNAQPYLTGVPDERGTVIAEVIYMEDRDRPHPFLSDSEAVQLVAFPSMLEVRKKNFSNEELVSIPWDNISNIYVNRKGKGSGGTFLADVVNAYLPVVGYGHDGVVIQYQDAIFHSNLTMFFRTRGEKNASKLTKMLMQRLYDYRRRKGDLGGSF